MWLLKFSDEIVIMCIVVDILVCVYCWVMMFVYLGCFEYQFEVEIYYEFVMVGVWYFVYGIIVGGGENVCILYYIENQDVIVDGSLILIDVGVEYNGYVVDII